MRSPVYLRDVVGFLGLALALVGGGCAGSDAGPSTGAAGSSSAGASGSVGQAGSTGSAGVGAAGLGDAGGAAGDSGGAGVGVAGASGTGTAGAAGVGAAGTGGAAGVAGAVGAAGTTGGGGSGSLTMGMQSDPGTTGDGTVPQPGPYAPAPEELMHLNNAPVGKLLGPLIHTQTGTYTGWSQWKFTYWVYVPAQYKPGHAAALMIFQDGMLYSDPKSGAGATFNTPTVFDNLIAEGSMPVTIGVFIDPGTTDGHHVGGGDGGRGTQYDSPNNQYGKFLLQEFIPAEITSKYDIVTDADGWGLGGHSSGGVASIIAAWYWPGNFHKVVTASPSFPNAGGHFPAEFLTVMPAKPLRIYHLSGTQDLGGFRAANDQAAKDFMMLGYHYRYRPGTDVHFPPHAALADFADALRWAWRGYKAGL
jgi:enterochelin esterase-like enzyme